MVACRKQRRDGGIMKTKHIVLLIGLLIYASSTAAQTRFYDVTRTFHESGFTYQADVSPAGGVVLYNRANHFTNLVQIAQERRFRDGRRISEADREIDDVISENWTRPLARNIVRDAFSATERSRLRQGEQLGVIMIICSDTGNVREVLFEFWRDSGYATIPVSTWRRIELELKRQIQFTPTAHGRSMNFLFWGWHIDASQ